MQHNPRILMQSTLSNVGGSNISEFLKRYSDWLVAIGVMALISIIIIPIPTFLVSMLVIFNLTISIVVLMVSLHISSPVQLTSYPTLLLLTTLFRLCLSIAITRSILVDGQAGDIVEALGHVTARGDIITGSVMFLIILVVQFIVVAKGAERVAEVGARFTLDAMPGKQMAIDADLRSGLINQEQAKQMRNALSKESQLYGAMDGAMKFVKGDSIATIVIALINIVAGLATGVMVHGLTLSEAGQKYTIFTIGDGLAAIISSVLITLSAGIVVTRVSSEEDKSNVGYDIGQQMLSGSKPWTITSGLIALLAIVPGMPTLPLLFAAICTGAISYSLHLKQKEQLQAAQLPQLTDTLQNTEDLVPTLAVPLAVVVREDFEALIDPTNSTGAWFRSELPRLRAAIYYDLGIMLPMTIVSSSTNINEYHYFIAIKETPVGYSKLKPGCVFVNDSAENIRVFGLEGEEVLNPADLKPGAWVPIEQRPIAEAAGLKVWGPAEVIVLHLSRIMRKYANEFMGIQEAQGYLDFAAIALPKLVEEVVPKTISISQFTEVLQRLIQEGISIRDLKTILEALSEWGRVEKDSVMLAEYVRGALKRQITFNYAGARGTLYVYLLDPEIEDVIRGAIRRTATGSFLSLDHLIANDILKAIRREIGTPPPSAQQPIIVTDVELRRYVKRMVDTEFPNLVVLSYQELTADINIQPIGRITMQTEELEQSLTDTSMPLINLHNTQNLIEQAA
jgi:type III secretion protein V